MTEKQRSAITCFFSTLSTVRGITNPAHTITLDGGRVLIEFADAAWPAISIGKQGGYGMPGIHSYPENGKASCYKFPGNTAFDAVLFGDRHLAKQLRFAARKPNVQAAVTSGNPYDFRLQFGSSEIGDLVACREKNVKQDDAFKAGRRIAEGDYDRENLRVIVDWKIGDGRLLGRELSLLDENTDTQIEEALRSATTADDERAAVEALIREDPEVGFMA